MKSSFEDLSLVESVRAFVFNPYIVGSVFLQGAGYIIWAVVVKDIKLGVAFALSGASFYILISIADFVFYKEVLSWPQILGIVLLSVGVFLVAFYK